MDDCIEAQWGLYRIHEENPRLGDYTNTLDYYTLTAQPYGLSKDFLLFLYALCLS
jgi:hypothetical protein